MMVLGIKREKREQTRDINDIYHSSNLETSRIYDIYMRILFVIVIKDRHRIIY